MLKSAKIKPKYICRYNDHYFPVIDCTEIELREFIEHMSNQNPSIQFTHERNHVSQFHRVQGAQEK